MLGVAVSILPSEANALSIRLGVRRKAETQRIDGARTSVEHVVQFDATRRNLTQLEQRVTNYERVFRKDTRRGAAWLRQLVS